MRARTAGSYIRALRAQYHTAGAAPCMILCSFIHFKQFKFCSAGYLHLSHSPTKQVEINSTHTSNQYAGCWCMSAQTQYHPRSTIFYAAGRSAVAQSSCRSCLGRKGHRPTWACHVVIQLLLRIGKRCTCTAPSAAIGLRRRLGAPMPRLGVSTQRHTMYYRLP